jgi:hypothetical protein
LEARSIDRSQTFHKRQVDSFLKFGKVAEGMSDSVFEEQGSEECGPSLKTETAFNTERTIR